jgi:hypothetical protein
MEQRITLIPLGVLDLAWAGFYYSSAFTDPDGHAWEVAHNPGFPLAADGTLTAHCPDLETRTTSSAERRPPRVATRAAASRVRVRHRLSPR